MYRHDYRYRILRSLRLSSTRSIHRRRLHDDPQHLDCQLQEGVLPRVDLPTGFHRLAGWQDLRGGIDRFGKEAIEQGEVGQAAGTNRSLAQEGYRRQGVKVSRWVQLGAARSVVPGHLTDNFDRRFL